MMPEEDIYQWYKHRRVTVIGGAGFVGQQLVSELLHLDAYVTVIDNFSRGKTMVDGADYVRCDATNIQDTYYTIAESGTNTVFNLAATVAGVLYNQAHHTDMYFNNINLLTVPVLAAMDAGVKNFLQTSSVCVYAPEHNAPSIETAGMSGVPHPANAGYAEAKRDGERFVLWSNIPKVVIARPSNIAGPGDYFDDKAHVIPAFIKRAFEVGAAEFKLFGDPDATREFIHPNDVAYGMLYAMALGAHGEAYNVGSHGANVTSIKDLVIEIFRFMYGVGPPNIVVDSTHGGGDEQRWSDCTKLHSLGWRHNIRLADILIDSIRDFHDNHTDA